MWIEASSQLVSEQTNEQVNGWINEKKNDSYRELDWSWTSQRNQVIVNCFFSISPEVKEEIKTSANIRQIGPSDSWWKIGQVLIVHHDTDAVAVSNATANFVSDI